MVNKGKSNWSVFQDDFQPDLGMMASTCTYFWQGANNRHRHPVWVVGCGSQTFPIERFTTLSAEKPGAWRNGWIVIVVACYTLWFSIDRYQPWLNTKHRIIDHHLPSLLATIGHYWFIDHCYSPFLTIGAAVWDSLACRRCETHQRWAEPEIPSFTKGRWSGLIQPELVSMSFGSTMSHIF